MNQRKIFEKLPADEIMRRLLATQKENEERDLRLYKKIIWLLTKWPTLTGGGVAKGLLDVFDRTERYGFVASEKIFSIPVYINALIDDEEVKADAFEMLEYLEPNRFSAK